MPARTALRWIAAGSLLLAMMLRILPLPREAFVYNPDWVLLFLIYWNMAAPERVGIGSAWLVGLATDALTGRLLGQHALAYTVVAYFVVKLHQRLRLYPMSQQILSVGLLLLLSQLLIFWTQRFRDADLLSGHHWMPSLTGALAWPLVLKGLRFVRRRFAAL